MREAGFEDFEGPERLALDFHSTEHVLKTEDVL